MEIKCKILVKKDKTEGFGNIQLGDIYISYQIPQLFMVTATIEGIASFLKDEKDKDILLKNWKLIDASININTKFITQPTRFEKVQKKEAPVND